MKKSRFTETQIIAVLKQVAAGQECERVRPAGGGAASTPPRAPSAVLRQVLQRVAGATPARIRLAQHAKHQQIVDVTQCRVG